MGNRTLFEALTGYESPAAEEADAPQILSAGTTDRDQSEPSEAEYPGIIEKLDERPTLIRFLPRSSRMPLAFATIASS